MRHPTFLNPTCGRSVLVTRRSPIGSLMNHVGDCDDCWATTVEMDPDQFRDWVLKSGVLDNDQEAIDFYHQATEDWPAWQEAQGL